MRAAQGLLPVTVYRPDGAGPFPFVVLLHGCGGFRSEAMWTGLVEPWADLLRAQGIGAAAGDRLLDGPRPRPPGPLMR